MGKKKQIAKRISVNDWVKNILNFIISLKLKKIITKKLEEIIQNIMKEKL